MNKFIPDMFEKSINIMQYYMEYMPKIRKEVEPVSKDSSAGHSRRDFLKLSAAIAVSTLAGCAPDDAPRIVASDSTADTTTTSEQTPQTLDQGAPEAIPSVPPQTTAQEVVENTPPTSRPEGESKPAPFIDPEKITPGQKIFDETVIQPDGTVLINLPVFADFMTDQNLSETILDTRGVLFEIVRSDINPQVITPDGLIRSQEALPGEVGRAQSFAHNQTEVDTNDDGIKEPMYRDLELIRTGATLELRNIEGELLLFRALDGGTEPNLAYRIVPGVRYTDQNGERKTNYEQAQLYRSQDTGGKKLYVLVACWPDGSTDDRIVVEFELVD